MKKQDPILASIPTSINLAERWLVEYWSSKLEISPGRLEQIVTKVGPNVSSVKKHIRDGFRIAIRDESGVVRAMVKIVSMSDGLAVSVPYHPAKQGWLTEIPVDYSQTTFFVPLTDMKQYTVEDKVKLSLHMTGFVQFSTASGEKIISGYNSELKQAKGIGLHAPDSIVVTTGPLFGLRFQGLDGFEEIGNRSAEVFEKDDLWHHPDYSTIEDTAYNLECFMLSRRIIGETKIVGNKRMLEKQLPFKSVFQFPHHLRVLEFPGLPYFLGVILSRIRPDKSISSGYKICGPGCGDPSGKKKMIAASYPRPDFVANQPTTSLDYKAP